MDRGVLQRAHAALRAEPVWLPPPTSHPADLSPHQARLCQESRGHPRAAPKTLELQRHHQNCVREPPLQGGWEEGA